MPNSAAQHLRSRISKVCVAITGASAAEMIERASAAVKETPFLEFRLDYLADPSAALPELKQFLAEHNAATAIATCRRKDTGGRFSGKVAAELSILTAAAEAGFHIVDLELESAEALKPAGLTALKATGVALIVSHHDFEATGDLDAIYGRIKPFAPDFVKIVPTAQCLTDNVKLMRFIERISDEAHVIGICMGDSGLISRVLGVRAGSDFTFAAATAGEETGPGQIAARTLIETYRIEEVDAATKVYGVAGDPVGKSLSPLMMNTAFRRETVNAVYLALQTSDVADLVQLIKEIPIQGVSITMPHKQSILPYLAGTDPLSAKIGACNTILRVPSGENAGKLFGFNTDVQGIIVPLEKRLKLKGAKVLVLGAGGSARAAVFSLRDKGAEVFILNRTADTSAKLAKQSGAKVIKREAIAKSTFDVILNATPVGMSGNNAAPLLTAEELNTRFVFDLVYNPVDTPLIKLARSKSIPVITGVEMFVQQGARQFEIWTGKPAPEEEMLKVIVHTLRQASDSGPAESWSVAAPIREEAPDLTPKPIDASEGVSEPTPPPPPAKSKAKKPAKPKAV